MPPMIEIDKAQCVQLARRLDLVEVQPAEFLVLAETPVDKRREANLWFFVVAICQATRTLEGVVDGTWYRGWDYMARAARRALHRDPELFTASRLANATPDSLRALFSDDGIADHTTLDRIDERVAQWHDAARHLIRSYDSDVMSLYAASNHRLRGEGGLMERLAAIQAYSDPVEKKSSLLVKFASSCGAWAFDDLDTVQVAIDYHIMRIALRSGMVRVNDSDLAELLVTRQPVSAEQDHAVRSAVRRACDLVVQHSAQSVFDVDNILWMMGRNCCFYDYAPICGQNTCARRQDCTFTRSIHYDCPGVCLFDGICLGSRDSAYRAYWETTLHTEFY